MCIQTRSTRKIMYSIETDHEYIYIRLSDRHRHVDEGVVTI
jgi:hypothetical protein